MPGPGDGVSFDMAVTPHAAQQLVISAKRIDMNDGGYVQVLEPEGEGWAVLAEAPVGDGENMVIPFIPDYGNIRIAFWGRLSGLFYTICDQKQEWVAEEQLVTICDEDKDKYRWGFNGIEKVNEVAGIGNHYQALYGDYSSRTGFRWNLDPKPIAGISPYAMFKGNPIRFSDHLLDTVKFARYLDEKTSPMTNVQAKKVWEDMVKFIHKYGVADEYDALEQSPNIYTVYFFNFIFSNHIQNKYKFTKGGGNIKESGDIYVNPWQTFSQGNYFQSGVEGMLHEIAHAYLFETLSIDEYNKESEEKGQFGSSIIEDKVIMDFEFKYADKLFNSGRRTSHWNSGGLRPARSWRPLWDKNNGSMPRKDNKKDNKGNRTSSSVLLQVGGGDAEHQGIKTIDPQANK